MQCFCRGRKKESKKKGGVDKELYSRDDVKYCCAERDRKKWLC